MTPEIIHTPEKKLVGLRLRMSFAQYRIAELWRAFGPRRREIAHAIGNDLISMAIYAPGHFHRFDPTREFERWAAVEVGSFEPMPAGMETYVLPAGLYAVFHYTGRSTDNSIFQYILGTWLPNSAYELDDRPHLEVLGDKYKNDNPESEEDIWIPIKLKGVQVD